MMRDTILLFTSIKEPVFAMSDEDAGKLFKAILAYQTGDEVMLDGLLAVIFLQVKQQIDYANKSYEERSALRSEAGKKGAEARWQTMANDGKRISVNGKNGKRISANGKNAINKNINKNVPITSSSCACAREDSEEFDVLLESYDDYRKRKKG